MADKFKLNIISPEKKFLEGDCEFLEFVSTEGELDRLKAGRSQKS